MFAVNFVLVPSNSLHSCPVFLTLGPELDNVGAAARLIEIRGHNFRLVLRIFSHGVGVK